MNKKYYIAISIILLMILSFMIASSKEHETEIDIATLESHVKAHYKKIGKKSVGISHIAKDFIPLETPRYVVLHDFEKTGYKVGEAKNTIYMNPPEGLAFDEVIYAVKNIDLGQSDLFSNHTINFGFYFHKHKLKYVYGAVRFWKK